MEENMKFNEDEDEEHDSEINQRDAEEQKALIEQEKKDKEISQKKTQSFSFHSVKDSSINQTIWGAFKIRPLDSLDILDNEPIYRTPIVNIIEGKNEYYLLLELPGLSKKNVELSFQEGILEVKGDPLIKLKEKKEEKKDKEKDKKKEKNKDKKEKEKNKKKDKKLTGNYLRREFRSPTFYRSFKLPEDINIEDIDANFKNGVLKLIIPKKITDMSEKHVIEIK